jgi:Carboxypeptidase regulatory-like domain
MVRSRMTTAASRARYNYAPVFAPGVTDPLTAATWTLAAGEERTGIDVRMQVQARAGIEGIVIAPGGTPSTDRARLSLSRRNRLNALNSTRVFSSGPDGRFTATALTPDVYHLMAEIPAGGNTPARWAMADVTLHPGETASITLTLQPALTISARVVFQGTTLTPPADLSTVLVRLWSAGTSSVQTTSQTDKSGVATIGGIVPGRYVVVGFPPGPSATQGKPRWSVRSVMMGDRDVTDHPIEIGTAGAPDVTVTFTDVVSELSGSLTTASGQPATDAFVIVMPADKEYWFPLSRRIASTRPDRSGRYVFHGLPAGEYRLAVTTDLTTGELQDANALAQLAAQSAAVTMTTGEKKVLDLRMAAGVDIIISKSHTRNYDFDPLRRPRR